MTEVISAVPNCTASAERLTTTRNSTLDATIAPTGSMAIVSVSPRPCLRRWANSYAMDATASDPNRRANSTAFVASRTMNHSFTFAAIGARIGCTDGVWVSSRRNLNQSMSTSARAAILPGHSTMQTRGRWPVTITKSCAKWSANCRRTRVRGPSVCPSMRRTCQTTTSSSRIRWICEQSTRRLASDATSD